MLLSELNKKFDSIEDLKNQMRSDVFRVVGISNGFSVITFLTEACDNLDLTVISDTFIEVTIDTLPTEALADYVQIKRQLDDFISGEEFKIQDDPIARERFIKYFREKRKGVNLYGIRDVDGNLL